MSGAALFAGFPEGLAICEAVERVVSAFGDVTVRESRSQVALRRRRGFAYVWRPGQYVRSDVPAVVAFALPEPIEHPRIKSVAHPSPGTFMHHVEVRTTDDLDDELVGWLRSAYDAAV